MKETKTPDWDKLRLEYVNTAISYEALAKKYHLKPGTIRQRANRAEPKWEDERNELSRLVTLSAQQGLLQKRQKELEALNEADLDLSMQIRNEILKILNEATDRTDQSTGQIIPGKPIAPKDLRLLATAAASAQKISRLAIGAVTDSHELSGPGNGPIQTAKVSLTKEEQAVAEQILWNFVQQ